MLRQAANGAFRHPLSRALAEAAGPASVAVRELREEGLKAALDGAHAPGPMMLCARVCCRDGAPVWFAVTPARALCLRMRALMSARLLMRSSGAGSLWALSGDRLAVQALLKPRGSIAGAQC